jgi:hypothetical protein
MGYEFGSAVCKSCRKKAADGINWTFSPMVDISREPRWGRVSEGSGEDPYLGSEIAKNMVYGYQGKDLANGTNIWLVLNILHCTEQVKQEEITTQLI